MDDMAKPHLNDVHAALETLRAYADQASPQERAALGLTGEFNRVYPSDFTVDEAYRAGLPDLQNGPSSLIRGAHLPIQHVGIAGFRLPLPYGDHVLETHVTGTVSLEADRKGINMSRIMRSFYAQQGEAQGFDLMDQVLRAYIRDLDSLEARLQMSVAYPETVPSLRSGLEGVQYYDIALETALQNGAITRILHLDYVYSSTCPCSLELSEHARRTRGQLATPHSQRSIARLSMVLADGADMPFGDVVALCRTAVPTETQVMVKREDEQAFAELNAANPIFVEDAVRLFAEALQSDERITDYRVVACHAESLHSHDAISVLSHGETFAGPIDPQLFTALSARI